MASPQKAAGPAPGPDPWPTSILGCFSDMGICVRGILPCFMAEDNAEAVGLLNNESPSCGVCCAMCCWPGLCGLLGATQATGPRQAIRQRYALDGNECTDILAYWCLPPCAVCQEARTIKHYQQAAARPVGAQDVGVQAVQAAPPPPQKMA